MTENCDLPTLPALDAATAAYVRLHRDDDVERLALSPGEAAGVDLHLALQEIEGRQRLGRKVPSWAAVEGLRLPPRLALEQCSGEAAALYKARLAHSLLPRGGSMADLTGGLGVDFAVQARLFDRCTYVEHNEKLCALARHNLPLLGLGRARIVCAEAERYLAAMEPVDWLYLDPARRDTAGRKTVFIADCRPDVTELAPLLLEKGRYVLLKLSPMLDTADAVRRLPAVAEVHVVADGGECKELLLLLCRGHEGEPVVTCVDGPRVFAFRPGEEQAASPAPAAKLRRYLYEPGAALLKAGALKLTAVRFGLEKLHPNSHLYTSDRLTGDFPGRTFLVEGVYGFSKKELRRFAADCPQANLTLRNFPGTTAELRRRLRLKEGGDRYCFATTPADGGKVLIVCRKVKG